MTRLTRITEHVHWMPPRRPDRPSLCAVVGGRRTLNARRRIVARAYQGISASTSRGGGGAPVRGRLHPLALRFGYQGSPVGQRIGVKHAGCGLITERGLLWRACEMDALLAAVSACLGRARKLGGKRSIRSSEFAKVTC